MKIFNWVHRKFHQKEEGGRRDVEKAELVKTGVASDTLALLQHVPLVNVLDGWKDGLLSIGTLGFDPFKDLEDGQIKQENEHFDEGKEYSTNYYHHNEEVLGDDENHEFQFEIYEEGETEMDPLVFKACKHGFDSDFQPNASEGHHDLDQFTCIDDKVGGNLKHESEREKKGERTTLADLFSADSYHMNSKKACDGQGRKSDLQPNIDSKKISADRHVKKGVSFFKKVIPHAKENPRPIKKLHKLMTKMLKRKIHPDVQSKETQLGVINKEGHGGTESLSLLQTQAVAT